MNTKKYTMLEGRKTKENITEDVRSQIHFCIILIQTENMTSFT